MLWICLHAGGWATAATGKVLELLLITGEAHPSAFLQRVRHSYMLLFVTLPGSKQPALR